MTIRERALEESSLLESMEPEERFEYLVDLGKSYVPTTTFTDKDLVKGCQAQVWFQGEVRDNRLFLSGSSDAILVKGLVAFVVQIYNDSPVQEAKEFDFQGWFQTCGIGLSMRRSQGLMAMLDRVQSMLRSS